MPYGRNYRKRNPKRRMPRRRRGLGVKSVKAIARQVVERGRETKSIQALINNYFIYSYAHGNGGTPNTVAMWSLTPNTSVTFPPGLQGLSQGNTAGTRVGNLVEFTKGTLRMMISCNPYNATWNPTPQPMVVKFFVGYDKTTAKGMPDNGLPNFFQEGAHSRAPTGNLLDMFSKVNTDRYVICYQRTVKVGNAEYFGTTTNPSGQQSYNYFTNNDFKLNPVVNIDFSKKMIHRAKFDDAVDTQSQRGTYCWLLMAPANGTSTVSGSPLAISCQLNNSFKDA